MMKDEASSLLGGRNSHRPTRSASAPFYRSFKKLLQFVLVICTISVILLMIINSRKEANRQGRSHSGITSEMVQLANIKQPLVHPARSINERAANVDQCLKQREATIASIYSLGGEDGGDIHTEIGASHVHTAYQYSIDAVSSDSGFFTPSETCHKQCCSRPYLLNSHVEQHTVLTVFSPRELAEVMIYC